MASLNLSTNGASIKSSYAGVVNGSATSNSPTHSQWALFSVQAPLLNAFQDSGSKESILKVESIGDGELTRLIEDFNDGRIQFAFVKVKDPNTTLPKYVLIGWCGEGVPERTKGYFTSHLAAVSKVLHGYHVQVTARSEADLEPAAIMKKVADASGAKYTPASTAGAAPVPPQAKTKPVFTPTRSTVGRIDPIVAARSQRDSNVDADGWGANAPPVTRTQIEKVSPAYQPTRVNMAELTSQKPEASRYAGGSRQNEAAGDVVKGGYQPVGKVDIRAIREQAKNIGDDRPAPVKGSYEPIGKVDIAQIRAKSQKADDEPENRTLAERAAAFSKPHAERMTVLPKPKVGKKFAGAASFTGTRAPAPGPGYGAPAPGAAPIAGTSRAFADEGGKTPAQIWAEKKARERGESISSIPTPPTAPVVAQKSGSEWKSGYTGKTWAPVQTGSNTRPPQDQEAVEPQRTGEAARQVAADPDSPARGVTALRDQFKNTVPISAAAPPPPPATRPAEEEEEQEYAAPPPPPASSRPVGGFQLPGLPSRPPVDDDEDDSASGFQPPAPREASPIRVAAPVSRAVLPLTEEPPEPPRIPASQVPVPREEELHEEHEAEHVARGAASAVAEQTFEAAPVAVGQHEHGGKRAIVLYDYEKAEDNEIDLVEGHFVSNIDQVDEDWWLGVNAAGETGLFPSNYVELIEDDAAAAAHPEAPAPPHAPAAPEPEHAAEAHAGAGATATALYDYEAAEDNELSFPEDATITDLEFPDEDWWFGHYNGHQGLFPANYVQLNA
ncbi:Protein app1 [Escovopsis weberi]|uniref:Protein app1 n=1 Tax=Escovopsis weberi TaxID=150374 RepID=A0A0M8MXN5_ESCWE|nr:Protein app1 [Escovopsis weberi]